MCVCVYSANVHRGHWTKTFYMKPRKCIMQLSNNLHGYNAARQKVTLRCATLRHKPHKNVVICCGVHHETNIHIAKWIPPEYRSERQEYNTHTRALVELTSYAWQGSRAHFMSLAMTCTPSWTSNSFVVYIFLKLAAVDVRQLVGLLWNTIVRYSSGELERRYDCCKVP